MKNKKILILGGAGYIGSRLWQYLKGFDNYELVSWDLEWFGKPDSVRNHKYDIKDLTKDYLEDIDVVVLLAGHSSVQMCHHNYHSAWANNVTNFMWLTSQLNSEQKLIYASSSSVYGEWPEQFATETGGLGEPVNPYDHTKQTIDNITNTMYKHNMKLGKPALNVSFSQCNDIWGLRFGTVNGYSENFRSDVMINAMWNSAKTYNKVKVYNGDTRRSILGITDLCRAIHTIIEKGRNPKVYNLASFHSTSVEIGKTVANLMDVPCVEAEMKVYGGNEKMTTKNYDFWVSTDQFCSDFDFTFTESIGSIVEDINFNMAENKLKGIRTICKPRDKHIPYGY